MNDEFNASVMLVGVLAVIIVVLALLL